MVLDPIADARRLGSRYCTGGYIWQVVDGRLGELFAGPEYPREPNTFDGQGAPEMFKTALGAEGVPVGGEVECIGVGRVLRTSAQEPFDVRYNREVIEFVKWSVEFSNSSVTMRTEHAFRDWAYDLTRKVTLHGRTIGSATTICSRGAAPLPIRWFAHPFFPIAADNVMCRFSFPVSMPDNPGYSLNADKFVVRKASHDWRRGWLQALDLQTGGRSLVVVQKHPLFGQVTAATDFPPAFLPIWGNDRTFSFEPYFEQTLAPGTKACWSIKYSCGKGPANMNQPS